MSVSSGSDITIPIQDSPPPPPSPYANTKRPTNDNVNKATNSSSSSSKNPTDKSSNGIDNVAYQQSETTPNNFNNYKSNNQNEKDDLMTKNHTTSININGYNESKGSSAANDVVNGEVINMNVLDTIPIKPQPEFGPFENYDQYFIPVNQHKKILRGEKLYVTKDKRKTSHCGKYICWFLGALLLAAIITIAVLAAVGLFPPKSSTKLSSSSLSSTTSNPDQFTASSDISHSTVPMETDFITSTTTISPIETMSSSSTPTVSDIYVPYTADATITLDNAVYEEALSDPTSEAYRTLAASIEAEIKNKLETEGNLRQSYVRVIDFSPGSVIVKLRISWMDRSKHLPEVQRFLSTLHALGEYSISAGTTSYAVLNSCKMNNNGCSNFCTFDYESLEFVCTCPEELILGADNKTCQPAETSSISPSPSFEISSGRTDLEPSVETTSESENDTTSASVELQPQPSEEPTKPESTTTEVSNVTSVQDHEHEPTTAFSTEVHDHDQHEHEHETPANDTSAAIPADEVEQPTTHVPEDYNTSLMNDTSSSPDFDYNTDAEILTPEVVHQHHQDKDKLVVETTTPYADLALEIHSTSQPYPEDEIIVDNDTQATNNVTSEHEEPALAPQHQEHEETSTMGPAPNIPSDSGNIHTDIEITTPTPHQTQEDHQNEHTNSSSESTVDIITPFGSHVESADDVPPTILPIGDDDNEEPTTINPFSPEENIQFVNDSGIISTEQRNSSSRALLKDQDEVQDISNSNEEEPQQIIVTELPSSPRPPVHSDEFMAFSDANMTEINSILTPKTENGEQQPTELPSTHSIESMTSYEAHDNGENHQDASMSTSIEETPQQKQEPQISSEEVDAEQVVPIPEATTTITPISLMNDTVVNNLTEGITEDLTSAEYLTTKPASVEVETITEDSQQVGNTGPEGEQNQQHQQPNESQQVQEESQEPVTHQIEVVSDHQEDHVENPPPTVDVETLVLAFTTPNPTSPEANGPINEWTRSVAEFISIPAASSPAPTAPSALDSFEPSGNAESGPEQTEQEHGTIFSTTIDILRRNSTAETTTPIPNPNPYEYITNKFTQQISNSETTTLTTAPSPSETDQQQQQPSDEVQPQHSPEDSDSGNDNELI